MSAIRSVPDWLSFVDPARDRVVEIGALDKPSLAGTGARVTYVDHATTAELRRKYADDEAMADRLDHIVDVDHVWSGDAPLADMVAEEPPFDVVVASHVVEHVPDLIGWLGEIADILAEEGVLALAVPDMRFCFDANRDLTTMADLVDAHLRGLRRPSLRQVYDFHSRIVPVDAGEVWAGRSPHRGTWRSDLDPDDWAMELCRRQQAGEYVDGHCQVFTPDSFVDLTERLSRLGLIDFELADLVPTGEGSLEFHVLLRTLPVGLDDRARLARQLAAVERARAAVRAAPRPPEPDRPFVPGGHDLEALSASELRLIRAKRALMGRVHAARAAIASRRRTTPSD